jgi:arylsulfatase A-like enzyme
MAFIRKRADVAGQPFFLYLPLTAPHTPWVPADEFRGKSKAGDYGDFVVQVDDALGQIMRTLDETGLAGNTLLIFSSDNGAHWTPQDKRGKVSSTACLSTASGLGTPMVTSTRMSSAVLPTSRGNPKLL